MRLNEAWENVRNIWCDNVATVFPSVWRTSFLQLYRPQHYAFIPLTIGWEGTIIVQPINNLEPELTTVCIRKISDFSSELALYRLGLGIIDLHVCQDWQSHEGML